jgi:mannitol/fructose-specific phosphotransferase system IIA component (Ntr-type)
MENAPIRPRTILSPLMAAHRHDAFLEIIDHLVRENLLPADQREIVLQSLEARERKLTTAIGNGLALPHASIAKLPGALTALAVSPQGIAADAPDGQPVRLFYVLLVPAEDYALHLRTVAAVTRFFRTPGIFERLHAAQGKDALLALFPA